MSAIPLEILTIAFKDLELKVLTQCQLVCKQWNQASVKQLYSDIVIDTLVKSRKYARTIKRDPRLGQYLEIIKTGIIFKKTVGQEKWDEHGLLETIINHCPNLLELHGDAVSAIFWKKLMHAASQERLARLQFITCPWDIHFDLYVNTVLVFKKSINELELTNTFTEGSNLRDLEAIPILLKNLNQFPCLETLIISYETGNRISHFDRMIDDCRYLKELALITASYGEAVKLETIIPESSIKPHVLIHRLECNWYLIKTDNQLIYTMKKFPNLKSLRLICTGYGSNYNKKTSPDVLMKFIRFATNIQNFDLNIVLDLVEVNTVWADFINEKFRTLNIMLGTSADLDLDDNVEVKFVSNRLELLFAQSSLTGLYCTNILSEIGKNIQSLSLCNGYDREVFNSIEKIVRTIQHCPSTQNLTLNYVDNPVFLENTTYQHLGVNTLTLRWCKHAGSDGILKDMSLILPNLKTIHLYDNKVIYGKSGALIIDIPNASLDILKWSVLESNILKKEYILEIYVRLKTSYAERFYMAYENKLSSITANQYIYPRADHIYLDITCKNLIKLELNEFTYTI